MWQSFDGLAINNTDLSGNVQNLRLFFRADSVAKELEKTDRNRWGMTPQTVVTPTTVHLMKLYSLLPFYNHLSLIQMPIRRLTMVQLVR